MRRRRLPLLLAILMLLQPFQAFAQVAPAGAARLPEGTKLLIRPPYDVRSDKAKTGDQIDFLVAEPVVVNGVTVIEKGARARVTITEAKHASGFGQNGRLKLAVNDVVAADGRTIRLRGTPDSKGGDNTALSVAGIVLLSVLFVFMQGREAVLKADKTLAAYTDEARDVGASAAGVAPAASASALQRMLLLESPAGDGPPARSTWVFEAKARAIYAWVQLAPSSTDRVIELRWSLNGQLVTASSVIMRAGQTSACAQMEHDATKPFAAGAWRVEASEAGQRLGGVDFVVKP